MAAKKQTIKCEVDHCKFNDEGELCTLNEIKVCNCDCGDDGDKENTLCGSYKCKKE